MKREDINVNVLMYDPWGENTVSKLESYDEFKEDFGIEKSKVISYIILAYDLNTQLRKEVPYFNQRKIISAELSGFVKNKDGKFKDEYEKVLIGNNDKVNLAISKYIRLFASPKYLSLVYYWSILSAEFENVTKVNDSKDFKNTIANIEKLETKINECIEFLFGGNEVTDIRQALYESVEKENLKLRPENIAMAGDNELDEIIGDSPYGDYKPSPLKYKGHK
jgi:hypothetical protein